VRLWLDWWQTGHHLLDVQWRTGPDGGKTVIQEVAMKRPVVVSIIVPPQAEPSVVVGCYDSLWSAGVLWNRIMGETEAPRFEPQLIGLTSDPVLTATGVQIVPHRTFADGPAGDFVLVPTMFVQSGREFGRRHPDIVDWVRSAHDLGRPVFSTCTGSFLLAEAGLLDNRDATTHWAFVDQLKAEYPLVRVHGSRVLVAATPDSSIVTCGGAASWMDMVLYLVGRFASADVAMQLAKVQMLDWHHSGQTPYARLTTKPQTVDGLIHECQEWLADNYAVADPVKAMIDQSRLSRRSFGRRFHAVTGYAPLAYVQRVRIEEAKQLLETSTRTIEQVSIAVGYGDTVSFRRLFSRMVGETPAAYRRRQSVSQAVQGLPCQPQR
jgi:transcriptional regulator GlxA family with amidase domain